jgi:UDP-glucose 4-epimerase
LLKYSHSSLLKKFIFSSTCAIYGEPTSIPVNEQHPVNPQNPYASSKWMCENILRDSAKNRKFKAISLRYFNPIGVNVASGLREFYTEKSKNIIPQILRVMKNEQPTLSMYGDTLPTRDGSGVRDYIHVEDLVTAHIRAMEFLDQNSSSPTYDMFNLGTGIGISVLELVQEFKTLLDKDIPLNILEKRPNEVSEIYADASKINKEMHWTAQKDLHQMVHDVLLANELID